MADTRTPEQRRAIMKSVRQVNTGPEIAVRKLLHRMGFRFRLHRKDLPGTPDIVFPSRRKVIFVHGCYWHGHGCSKGQLPKSHLEYWSEKIKKNIQRDDGKKNQLNALGWNVLTIWQCEIRDVETLRERLNIFLS